MFLFSGFVTIASAQETTSEIQGIVKNGNNIVSGATISATHQPTGTTYTVTSRKDGRYNLSNLKIGGPYIIKITNVGFKEQKRKMFFFH